MIHIHGHILKWNNIKWLLTDSKIGNFRNTLCVHSKAPGIGKGNDIDSSLKLEVELKKMGTILHWTWQQRQTKKHVIEKGVWRRKNVSAWLFIGTGCVTFMYQVKALPFTQFRQRTYGQQSCNWIKDYSDFYSCFTQKSHQDQIPQGSAGC